MFCYVQCIVYLSIAVYKYNNELPVCETCSVEYSVFPMEIAPHDEDSGAIVPTDNSAFDCTNNTTKIYKFTHYSLNPT